MLFSLRVICEQNKKRGMIDMEHIAGNIVKIVASGTLEGADFSQLSDQVDALLKEHEKVRLLINATDFSGWDSMNALTKHFGFVKSHHHRVERIAFIMGHQWQQCLVGAMRMFIHPEVHVFGTGEEVKAESWIKS